MENLTVKLDTDKPEITIRQGEALPLQEKNIVEIRANIKAPGEYLEKCRDQIDGKQCYVEASLKGMNILLTIGKHAEQQDSIMGELFKSDMLSRLPVNEEKAFSAKDLGKLLKKNKFLFPDEEEFNKLVGKLLRFQAKVTSTIEKTTEQSGNTKDLLERQVNSEIPESFVIKCPIFEGMEDEVIRVEIYAEATSDSVRFTLESTELISLTHKRAREIFEEELKPFVSFCPVFHK